MTRHQLTALVLVVVPISLSGAVPAFAQSAETVFRGKPTTRVVEGGIHREATALTNAEADGYLCVISKIGDRYYWASRENRELGRRVSGAFVTYVALDGSGYVRHIDPDLKEAASLLGPTEAQFDYSEHILLGLSSISYYGRAR